MPNPAAGGSLENLPDRRKSALDQLVLALNIDPRSGLVAMLTGYFDESGTHQGAVVTTVAGFISTPDRWEQLEGGWRTILKRWGLSSFHMSECAHCTGEFSRFKDDEAGRRELLSSLAIQIYLHCHCGCGASVINAQPIEEGVVMDKLELLNVYPPIQIGSTYSVATMGCLALANAWMEKVGQDGPLELVLERGCKYSKELLQHLEERERPLGALGKFSGITFRARKDFPALQAADFLAYEQGKYLTDCVRVDRAVKPRKSLEMLFLPGFPHYWKLFDTYTIADLLVTMVTTDLLSMDRETLRKLDPWVRFADEPEESKS